MTDDHIRALDWRTIVDLCAAHLSSDEAREVVDACDRYPKRMSALFALEKIVDDRPRTGPDVARAVLRMARQAVRGEASA